LWMGPDKGELAAHFVSPATSGIFPKGEFLEFLKSQSLTGNTTPLVLESLVRLPDNGAADIEFADSGETPGNKAPARMSPVKSFEASALGINYSGAVPMVLAMSMDGVKALTGKSIFDDVFRAVFRQLRRPVSPARKGPVKQGDKLEDFYTKWLKIHVKKKSTHQLPETASTPDLMPKVLGFSLRKALQRLSGHGLKLQIIGAGHVVNQMPKYGVQLKDGQNCLLELNFSAFDNSKTGEKKRVEAHGATAH